MQFLFGIVKFGVDTTTYLQLRPWVPLGYPMFLSAIKTTISLRFIVHSVRKDETTTTPSAYNHFIDVDHPYIHLPCA